MTPRLNIISMARKANKTCETCKQLIQVGEPYLWWKPYSGRKHFCHSTPACRPSDAQRETNSKRQSLMFAAEAIERARSKDIDDPAGIADCLREAIDHATSAAEEFGESLDNWQGTGLENTEQAQNFEQAKESLEEWVSNAESWADELDELEGSKPTDEPGEEPDEPGDEPSPDDYEDGDEDDEYIRDYADHEESERLRNEWTDRNEEHETWMQRVSDVLDGIEDVAEVAF